MNRSTYARLVATSLMLACPGASEDDSGADSSTVPPGGIPTLSPTSTGNDDATGSTTEEDPTATSDDTGPGDDSTTDILNCGVDDIVANVTIPRVMLVLDKSGSMITDPSGYWDHDADPNTPEITRWQSLYETVDFIVGDFEERMDFGAVLFPSLAAKGVYNASACPVSAAPDVAIGPDQGPAILATIPPPDSTKLAGGTPATAGILTGITGLATADPEEDARPKYIILVTDGAANCPIDPVDDELESLFEVYDSQLPVVVGDAAAQGIGTFVVGIDIEDVTSNASQDGNPDNTNAYEKLNEVAEAGGQPRAGAEKFYNTVNQVELQAALMAISETITSCIFPLSTPLSGFQYVDSLIVDKDGNPLKYGRQQVDDCATESGWKFTDETKAEIELCGDACTLYKQTGDVDIIFQCDAG